MYWLCLLGIPHNSHWNVWNEPVVYSTYIVHIPCPGTWISQSSYSKQNRNLTEYRLISWQQESFPVLCVLPTCRPYELQKPPDISTGAGVLKWSSLNRSSVKSHVQSRVVGPCIVRSVVRVAGLGLEWVPVPGGPCPGETKSGCLYGEVQYIMYSWHICPPTRLKTLPSCKLKMANI